MSKSKLIVGIVSASFLLSIIPAKKIIDSNIKKSFSKEVAVTHFLNDFPFKLTPENEKKANEVILRLYNDKEVFEKVSAFSRDHSKLREKIIGLLNKGGSTASLDSASKIINLQKQRFSSLVTDLAKNPNTSRNLDTLFSVFSTNKSFKDKFTIDLVQTQLRKNPLYLVDKGFLLKRKPNVDIFGVVYDYKNKVKGFNTLNQRKVSSAPTPALKSKKLESIPQKKPEIRRRPGR